MGEGAGRVGARSQNEHLRFFSPIFFLPVVTDRFYHARVREAWRDKKNITHDKKNVTRDIFYANVLFSHGFKAFLVLSRVIKKYHA